MSEGTPGHGPDADSRTDAGEGQAATTGRPAAPPVRYGPRNGSASSGAKGRGGPTGRTVPGSGSPQQYRAPQPPRPANGAPANGTPASGPATNGAPANGASTNGSVSNGAGSNGSGSNGSGTNGAHPAAPSPYARPRTNGTSSRPEPSEQERLISEARTAAAARNASAAKVRGGSALSPRTPAAPVQDAPSARADETAVIPVVPAEMSPVAAPSGGPGASTTEETVAPEKGRDVLGRLRDGRGRRLPRSAQSPQPATSDAPAVQTSEPEPRTEPLATDAPTEPVAAAAVEAKEQAPAAEERRVTWRDRLGLAPREPKPQPQPVLPEAATETPFGAAAAGSAPSGAAPAGAAVAAVGAAGATAATAAALPTARLAPTVPTPEPAPGQPVDRVAPVALVPATSPDTVEIPVVDGEAVAPGTVAQPGTKPKVGAARRTRKARLRLSRVDPWSVMKTALLFSIAAGIILVVATYGVWSVLSASGLFEAVNDMVKSVVSTPGDTTPFRIEDYVNTQKIIGVAALIAVADVLIFTALATLGSFLYNLAATVLGGLEVTLAED